MAIIIIATIVGMLANSLDMGTASGGNTVQAGQMEMQWEIVGEWMEITLEAPTQGWLAVGFNYENSLVGADLKMAAVKNGELILSDQQIVGMGDHRPDEALGGKNEIQALHWEQTKTQTQVRFRIPLQTGEKTDYQHTIGQTCWVILAWSVSPDFDHHSRERNHVQVQF